MARLQTDTLLPIPSFMDYTVTVPLYVSPVWPQLVSFDMRTMGDCSEDVWQDIRSKRKQRFGAVISWSSGISHGWLWGNYHQPCTILQSLSIFRLEIRASFTTMIHSHPRSALFNHPSPLSLSSLVSHPLTHPQLSPSYSLTDSNLWHVPFPDQAQHFFTLCE